MQVLEPKEIITTISNKKTGEKYKDEAALKAANIPEGGRAKRCKSNHATP